MTESEAKTKWCPMRRITRLGSFQIDNTDGKEFTLNCIGSACMMWRENEKLPPSLVPHPTAPNVLIVADDPDVGGYCGLAGKQ